MQSRERENMEKKPKHFGDGLLMGLKSAGRGFESGLTGVITKPVEGAKKKGIKGLLSGAWQGVSGLVIKPVSGTLDLLSKTTQGIQNTGQFIEELITDE